MRGRDVDGPKFIGATLYVLERKFTKEAKWPATRAIDPEPWSWMFAGGATW